MLNKELFQGKYRIIKTLGQGGMGKVYLAKNVRLGSLWAIKAISKKSFWETELLAEPNILKKLNHPSLPRVYDIVEDKDNYYIIVDFIEGTSLDKKLKENGQFPEATVIKWAKQICDVLIYLHNLKPNPIIYRDMKPSNIILTKEGNIKLIDFGIAREYKEDSKGDTVYIGTRGYAAPEQYGGGQSNPATDIYSMGITLYELMTGIGPNQPPYGTGINKIQDENISKEIKSILIKCTKPDPAERYQSVEEVLEDIDRIGKDSELIKKEGFEEVYKAGCKKSKNGMVSFKKLILTVWDNAEFGCELAYAAAKMTDFNVVIADLDLLAPKADLYLNVRKTPGRIHNEGIFNDSGVNIVMDSIEKNFLTSDILVKSSAKRRELRNLFVLTGNYRLENYEYYKEDSLIKLIEKCYQSFDITVLLVNKSIYDSYTIVSLIKSDFNIIPIPAEVGKLREFNCYLKFLKESQQIPMVKTKFVAFEYDRAVNLSEDALCEITGRSYLGSIRASKRRAKYRNLKIPYARRMESDVLTDYAKILAQFNIVAKPSFLDNIKMFLNKRVYKGSGDRCL